MIENWNIEEKVGPQALKALKLLEDAGFEAWAVGGCLRDCLLGRNCHDVDITTSALPQQIEAVFSDYRLIETGIAHGTVTVLLEGRPLEITTYRLDGAYEDHRRPSEIKFTLRLEEDLARRDFTVNAMAWNPKRGLVDPFGGREDLHQRILRCVGEARRRFAEDALRILRALRFSATYGFEIEEETAKAMEAEQRWLRFISAERIWTELKKTLASPKAAEVMRRYGGLWKAALSEFPSVEEEALQWMKASNFEKEDRALLQLTLLLGGDLERTKRLASQAKMSRPEETVLTDAARLWNHRIPKEEGRWKRWIYTDGYDAVLRAVAVQSARSKDAHRYDEQRRRVEQWRENGECVTLAQLSIDGNVLMERGVPAGMQIKTLLERALFGVMDGETENEQNSLLRYLNL